MKQFSMSEKMLFKNNNDLVNSALVDFSSSKRQKILDNLQVYNSLLCRWNRVVNLVGQSTLKDSWARHFGDSAQIFAPIYELKGRLVDLGAGAGFPGLVLAIMGIENVTLVESDGRKCRFLKEVANQTKTKVTILNQSIEALSGESYDVIVSRALAPLDKLLSYSSKILSDKGVCFFLKGKSLDQEVINARKYWHFDLEKIPSKTSCDGWVIKVKHIHVSDSESET